MSELKFGQSIIINNKLVRKLKSKPKNQGRLSGSGYKYWHNLDIKEQSAIFLGFRTLKNGWRTFDSDEGWYFEADEAIIAALVCTGKSKNPFYTIIKLEKEIVSNE